MNSKLDEMRKSLHGSLLTMDAQQFVANFDRAPFKVSHQLVSHPLLQLPRLVELTQSLNRPVLFFRGDHSINQVTDSPDSAEPRTFEGRRLAGPEMSAAQVIEKIESAGAWMQLRNIGTEPHYAELLRQIIEEFREPAEHNAPGLSDPRMDIFVSSPGTTTPFHVDEEHNFLLQIRGSKKLSVANGSDPAVFNNDQLRAYFKDDGELIRYSENLEQRSTHVELHPGEGLHIPAFFPHWVKNGDAVSISVGVLWHSDVTAHRRHLNRVNGWLERAGLPTAAPGEHPVVDSLKTLPFMIKRRMTRTPHP
jgi:Cupin-like domain